MNLREHVCLRFPKKLSLAVSSASSMHERSKREKQSYANGRLVSSEYSSHVRGHPPRQSERSSSNCNEPSTDSTSGVMNRLASPHVPTAFSWKRLESAGDVLGMALDECSMHLWTPGTCGRASRAYVGLPVATYLRRSPLKKRHVLSVSSTSKASHQCCWWQYDSHSLGSTVDAGDVSMYLVAPTP